MTIKGNVNQKANLIWIIDDVLTGTYKTYEYGEPTAEDLAIIEKYKSKGWI